MKTTVNQVQAVWFALVLVFSLALPGVGHAQQNSAGIFTLSQDRLFNQSEFGIRVLGEIDLGSQELTRENRRIEEELKTEEQVLTDQRPTLSPSEFRVLADAFDEKVEGIRKTQGQKTIDLTTYADTERQRFFEAVFPILVALAEELNALAILDERSVIISSDQIDITVLAIARVNGKLGDGAKSTEP